MKTRLFFLALVLAMIPVAVYFLDKPCSLFFRDLNMQVFMGYWSPPTVEEVVSGVPEDIREVFACIEILGNKIGVFVVILLCATLGGRCWRNLSLLVGSVVGAAGVGYVLKKCIVRDRPFAFDFQKAMTESFGGFSPFKNSVEAAQSFPSGHTIAAAALVTVLAWLYPQQRWTFYGLLAWLMMYRVAIGAHYFSDTLAGLFAGAVVAYVCILARQWVGRREL